VNNLFCVFKLFILGLWAITEREIMKFVRQRERFLSSLVRPSLWLFVFAVGSQNILGVSIIEPYETYTPYQEYILPGMIGIIILFQSMQSSLSMVYDREAGVMKVMLLSPLPRGVLLFGKMLASTILSFVQIYIFLFIAAIFGISLPTSGLILIIPAIFICGFLLSSLGLCITLYARQIENFAGIMNFVVFPMFFLSSALYPLWKLRETGSEVLFQICLFNPFTHVVELLRYAAYSKFNLQSASITMILSLLMFLIATNGYKAFRGKI